MEISDEFFQLLVEGLKAASEDLSRIQSAWRLRVQDARQPFQERGVECPDQPPQH